MTLAAAGWLGMELADWLVLALYFVVILFVGIWSSRKVTDMADFFMGGRRFGKVFMMFFAFGSGTSSEQAISVVAGTWRVGLAGIWWQFLWLWATPFYWIVAPVLRRMRALTTADYFEARFSTSTATLYSIYGIIISIVFIAGGLYSSGKMVNALTGGELDRVAQEMDIQVPQITTDESGHLVSATRRLEGYEFAILAMTVLFVSYGMAGGLGAAIITDFIQGVLTITFSFLLLPFVFNMIGGFGALHSQGELKPGMFDLVASPEVAMQLGKEPITLFYVFMLSLTALCGIVVQPHIMGVCGAGKTEFEGRFGFTVGNFLKRFCTIAWTFTGLACIVWYMGDASPLKTSDNPDDVQTYNDLRMRVSDEFASLDQAEKDRVDQVERQFADELFGKAAYDILPSIMPGLVGLLLASLLAAVMSTSDAQMVVSSGLFTENLYRRFMVRNASPRHYLWVGRLAGLVIVLVALVLQATFQDVIDALKVIIKTPAAIGISLWFGVIWRRWNSAAVWCSTLSAGATWWFVAYHPDWIQQNLPFLDFMFNNGRMFDAYQMACYLLTGIVVGVVVSLTTPDEDPEKLDRFFRLIHTPVRSGEHVERPCTLPDDPLPAEPKLFNISTIEIPKLTTLDVVGFLGAWGIVGLIIWLTKYLSVAL